MLAVSVYTAAGDSGVRCRPIACWGVLQALKPFK